MPTQRWLCGPPALLLAGTIAWATTADRPAAAILDDINAVKIPEAPKSRATAVVRAYNLELRKAETKKQDLVKELFQAQPDHPELAKLLPPRWEALMKQGPGKSAEVGREATAVLESTRIESLKIEAAHVKAEIAAGRVQADPDGAVEAIDVFLGLSPKDARGAELLKRAARTTTDLALKVDLRDRLARDFPEAQPAARAAAGNNLREAIGKPFKLEFTDAISGTPLSMGAFKGKVVVIDFWATWCGPCVAEMPKMKKLYAEYRDQGVEFIGVSLDQPEEQGGLAALRSFVDKNEILWPQYYQGGAGGFSQMWGVDSIPRLFIVDAEGNLASTEARGKLETLIPELLAKAKKPDTR